MRILSSVILLVFILGSCGLKGPLYLPENKIIDKQDSKEEGKNN
tara:strand:- start:2851 stop:2982 length:132 start_codon:yes stop_codon:yes gene_type:complete